MCAGDVPLAVWWRGPKRREALVREDEFLASGLGSGDGGKAANRGTCLMFPLGLKEGGVDGDTQLSSLDIGWTVGSLSVCLAPFLLLSVRHGAWHVMDALWVLMA